MTGHLSVVECLIRMRAEVDAVDKVHLNVM